MLKNVIWTWSVFDASESSFTFLISGQNAKNLFKLESGTHRVQRVPPTETKGRRHTSTIAVAILDYIEPYEVEYNESDFKFEVYKASGAGGQHRNKVETAVKVTHKPTGVHACSTLKSQHRNREMALAVVLGRLHDRGVIKQHSDYNSQRKDQIGNMGRGGAFVRNYNFIDGRTTDKRVNGNFRTNKIMNGDLSLIYKKLN
jgi:peptide chain release factor 1